MRDTKVKQRFGEVTVESAGPVDPGSADAQRLYLAHYATLSTMYAGSPEARAFLRQLSEDPIFMEHADEILEVNMQGPIWMDAFSRAAANRALRHRKQVDADEALAAYADNDRYGMF